MEKDPDEATVISSGSSRGFSGEKEHLVLSKPGHQGNGISSGMLMAMRRLDAAEAGGSLLLDARRLQQPVLIWLGELPALTPGEGWVVQPHGS